MCVRVTGVPNKVACLIRHFTLTGLAAAPTPVPPCKLKCLLTTRSTPGSLSYSYNHQRLRSLGCWKGFAMAPLSCASVRTYPIITVTQSPPPRRAMGARLGDRHSHSCPELPSSRCAYRTSQHIDEAAIWLAQPAMALCAGPASIMLGDRVVGRGMEGNICRFGHVVGWCVSRWRAERVTSSRRRMWRCTC